MLYDMMQIIESRDIKIDSLKSINLGGSLVPVECVAKFCRLVTSVKKIRVVYGATEVNAICGTTSYSPSSLSKLDNVGNPLEYVEVKIVDRFTKETVKIGEEGEVMVRGPNVFAGYYQDEISTQKAIDREGWYNTG